MKISAFLVLRIFLWLLGAQLVTAATIFQDGFESGSLGSQWAVSVTNDGRVLVSSNYGPASGQSHLILDDSVNDAVYSVAEATLTLDLSHKKNVVLSFQTKSLGNEPDAPPTGNFTGTRSYDGVAISTDGGTPWCAVQSLATIGTSWQSFNVTLDSSVAALGGSFGPGFRIRFSEYDNAPAPLDGIAIDEVSVTADEDQRAVLELPSPLLEGTGPQTGYIDLAFAPNSPLTFDISTSPAGQLAMPATVTVPAGQTYASFNFSVLDDNQVNLTRTITVNATAPGVTSTPGTVTIFDDEAPVVTLAIPVQLAEGDTLTNDATLTLDRAATASLTMYLNANPASEVSMPSTVIVPAGQTQVVFTIQAINDNKIDGNVQVTVTASSPGISTATAQTTTIDNETRTLSLTLPPTVQEGGSTTGTVSIPGTLPTPLIVNLASANPSVLTVPASVTIVAGSASAGFTITAMDNTIRDGSRNVLITATANTFTDASAPITIRDNEVAAYRFSGLTDIVNVGAPLNITVSAVDIEGNVISGFSGNVNLSLVLPDGSVQPVTPATTIVSGPNGWSGTVTLPPVSTPPLRLRATDANGNTGDSTSFDIMRVLALTAADLVWDSARNRIYASVPAAAGGGFANQVVSINPSNVQVAGSVAVNQDPQKLVLTNAGEALYVALDANGTITKIDPGAMSVTSTFAVGVSQYYGTLYAEDMCAVAGQPNLVVVSQYRKSVSPRHNGVAVYDNGVIRPNKTQEHTGSDRIESSADPTLFFGYNNETTEFGFRQLHLDANGMTEGIVNTSLIGGFSADIVSNGNTVLSTNGIEIDGLNMRRLGAFAVIPAAVRPDLAANRVYFIESQIQYSYSYDAIGAYDPTTFARIRRLSLPAPVSSAASFIRWGSNGLAFLTANSLVLINSSQLVPSDPPADLAVTVQATPNPASVGSPLTYTVQVTNQGPNISRNTSLAATLSDSQTIQNVSASTGTATTSGLTITLPVGDLAIGASATLTTTTSPQSAGGLSCAASANSTSVDPNFTNNTAFKFVSVGFQSSPDTVNQLRLTANNLIYDPARNLLWATIPNTVDPPLGRSVVSINPVNGLVSDPIALNANPRANCVALSSNGRYLYIGLSDSPEVHRIDLTTNPYTSGRVPLGLNQWGDAGYAEDLEVLDGDGTSFLVTTFGDDGACVFDGSVRRANRSGIYTVDRIERTASSGVFIGYDSTDSSYRLSRLSVTATGVSISQSVDSLVSGASEIRASGNLALSSNGLLVDSSALTLRANLGVIGAPCLDLQNGRAFIVGNDNTLRAFDLVTAQPRGTFALPGTLGAWAQTCVRWGLDGFGILGNDGKVYIARWSSTIPPDRDQNGDLISDQWEATYFGTLNVDPAGDADGDGIPNALEYLFGTSPVQKNAAPVQVTITVANGQKFIHIIFSRRIGVAAQAYGYETSLDLQQWMPAQGVTETILSTQTVGGVQVETVNAAIPSPASHQGFARLKWLGP